MVSCTKNDINEVTPQSAITDKTTKEEDNQYLGRLMQEINQSAKSQTCNASTQFKTTGVGAKPCGGPSGYMAYAANIDEAIFLKKVTFFNSESAVFNKKYGLMSDCMLRPAPKSVECTDGKPVLVY